MALSTEERKALLESLFAMPDKAKKDGKKKEPKKPSTPETGVNEIALAVNRNKAFKPTLAIIEIVSQTCTTCGSVHQYVQSRRVRFEAKAKSELHTAYEVQTIVPENLPRRVDHTWTSTEVCPTCLEFSTMFEDFLAIADRPIQKELFHG